MLYLPPNFKTILTRVTHPYFFENYRIILLIKDKEGNIIGKYEFIRIPESRVGYTEITTPSKEGVYIMEHWIYKKDGTPYLRDYRDLLIVSEKLSDLGLLHYLFNIVEKNVFRRLNVLCDRLESMCDYVENNLKVSTIGTWYATRDCLKVLDEYIFPLVNEAKNYSNDIKSKIEELTIPNLISVKNILQKFLKWLKKRNA